MNDDDNGSRIAATPINWSEPIENNIRFFREQSKLLNNAYNPSQVAGGAVMAILIMNHNMYMQQLAAIDQRLEKLETRLSKLM